MKPGRNADRYAVQERVRQIGPAGQARLAKSRAVVVGVGALGSSISHQLARSGVDTVYLIDSDQVELGNLHRQILYTEEDVREDRPKALAAGDHLRAANSQVTLKTVVDRLDEANADDLLEGADIVVDGTDNLASRYLINRACISTGIPWVYGGVAGTHGLVMPIIPGRGPCLRCLFEDPPEEEVSTASTGGVFGPAPAVIGAFEAALAIRILVGDLPLPAKLLSIDVWSSEADVIEVQRSPDCPACGHLR